MYSITESERSSTLDTLPEGKQVYSGSQSTYRKVHPDWKPSATIDKTDVVSAMEAVEGKVVEICFSYIVNNLSIQSEKPTFHLKFFYKFLEPFKKICSVKIMLL